MLDQMPDQLSHLVQQASERFSQWNEDLWLASRGAGKWTRIELLGHLIDSAANNHQRFVRALAQPRLDWPGYDQSAQVEVQNYQAATPGNCVALWASYNRLISHVIRQVTVEKASRPCSIGGAPEMTLSELMLDYVAHLEHHLKQLLPGEAIGYSGMPWPPADLNRQWPV